ncbi:DUF6309 family protein [Streptomyces sp. NPDC056500]|uniref:DUF6309 family protein n=1 Tax=Streptomyces sp. NPDC056500 TaxID=3345840 RepID=UPI003685E65B
MLTVAPVSFDEVLHRFHQEHPLDREHEENTNDEAEGHLHAADRTIGGWSKVLLDRSDLGGIVLPWHLGEGGERELIPKTGLTVARTVALLRESGPAYARSNPACGRKIAHQATSAFATIFLSVGPAPGIDYDGLTVRDGLTHLDGLHRMISWELHGRLTPGTRIQAYVAGGPAAGSGLAGGPLAAADVRHGGGHHRDGLDVHADG